MSDFTTLVNPDRIRQSIRRLFTNHVDEILGELFQNAQRAGATAVTITTTETTVTIHDNGHGLRHGAASFHTLLKLAESAFADPAVAIQDPMGLGIHALLAHTEVVSATFSSGGLELAIETARWWTDPAYYTSWAERLVAVDDVPSGLMITIEATPAFVSAMRIALIAVHVPHSAPGPAQGYHGRLTITFNGAPVDTTTPRHFRPGPAVITTTYAGNRLTIGVNPDPYESTYQTINWYGQLITERCGHCFWSYLEVTTGRPVNPLAPSRRGLIHDDAYQALNTAIIDHLFRWTADLAHRAQITPAWILALASLRARRTEIEIPYVVTAPWCHDEHASSAEDLMTTGKPEIHTYEQHPLLLDEELCIDGETTTTEPFSYGLTSFLPMLDHPHRLLVGDPARLPIHTLWWQPGEPHATGLNTPGTWGFGTNETPPVAWQPVTLATVYAFTFPHNWDIDDVDGLVVGCLDPIAFYQSGAWAAFDPENPDESYDEMHRSFRDSCERHIRALMGACVPTTWTLDDVWHVLRVQKRSKARIATIVYHYDDDDTVKHPSAMTVTQTDGIETRITFFA